MNLRVTDRVDKFVGLVFNEEKRKIRRNRFSVRDFFSAGLMVCWYF